MNRKQDLENVRQRMKDYLMPAGRHKGNPISTVPIANLQWTLDSVDTLTDDDVWAIQLEINRRTPKEAIEADTKDAFQAIAKVNRLDEPKRQQISIAQYLYNDAELN